MGFVVKIGQLGQLEDKCINLRIAILEWIPGGGSEIALI